MIHLSWDLFALGLFLGIVGTITALLAYVVVESVEFELYRGTGKEDKMFKNFFNKPIQVVTVSDIRPGDFIHDIADLACELDIEKRKGFVISVAQQIKFRHIEMRLTGRITSLEVPERAQAVITRETAEAKLISLKPEGAYV